MLKIFINYASTDFALVKPYVDRLRALGYDTWMDERLLPGQDWDYEIQRAFSASDVKLLFLTPRSVAKRGYVQREINDAIEGLKSLLPGDIGVLPLLLEECVVPDIISKRVQYIRVPQDWTKVIEALELAAKQRSLSVNEGVIIGPFRLYRREETSDWNGLPGYRVNLSYPHLESSRVRNAAFELNEYIRSLRLTALLTSRRARIEQDPDQHRHWIGEDGSLPFNELDVGISPVLVSDSIFCLVEYTYGYTVGAAHGFHVSHMHNFLLCDDSLIKLELQDLFADPWETLRPFTELVRKKASEQWEERWDSAPSEDEHSQIKEAFPADWDTFTCYSLRSNGITLTFPPYTLGGYAAGYWVIDLTFDEVAEWLKPSGPHSLARLAIDAEDSSLEPKEGE
ncbi:TIR domain-containing protein [Pseudoxanthomonas mexicana]